LSRRVATPPSSENQIDHAEDHQQANEENNADDPQQDFHAGSESVRRH
jgi:hypothetical protein